jgi:tRNA threonylcarbamoyladenosine biosynthesis protein TsaE
VREYRTATEEETIALGRQLASGFTTGDVVLLIGNLGAGKTTLAKGIVRGLTGVSTGDVSSPTFTLIHEYGDRPTVYHIDLYRLDTPAEVSALGLDDLFESGICLIEWGERFPQLMPERRVEITLDTQASETRHIRVRNL